MILFKNYSTSEIDIMYLFGYGSLINIKSAQKSFKRVLKQEDLIPVTVEGYEKVWNSIELIEFDDKKEVNGIFLNLRQNKTAQTNGVVLKISDEEFEMLKLREKNYSCITIKADCAKNINLDEDIIAFMTQNEEKIAKEDTPNCFIPSKYIDLLTSAFDAYSDSFIVEYKKCLNSFAFEVKEGAYAFCDAMQQKISRDGIK
jgi:cation transport regulator ChaC